jgi:hypothetical protein
MHMFGRNDVNLISAGDGAGISGGRVSGYRVHKWDMLMGADIVCDVAKINRVDFLGY